MRTKEDALQQPMIGDRWQDLDERNTILKVGKARVTCRTHFPMRKGSKIWIINDAVTTTFKSRERFEQWAAKAEYLGGTNDN